jgi:hypothetical protein
MNDDWECPKCSAGYDAGSYPDHVYDSNGQFEFECEKDGCGHTFTVEVEYYPSFRVISSPAPDAAGKR